MRLLAAAAVVATLGIWGWALYWPKKEVPPTLPARYVHTYRVYRFEHGAESRGQPSPFPQGQDHYLTLREDGTYLWLVKVKGTLEMLRREGWARIDSMGVLTMTQVSENRVHQPSGATTYTVSWGKDTGGEFLLLTDTAEGSQFYLRVVP